jgi:type II secretory pathway component PulK
LNAVCTVEAENSFMRASTNHRPHAHGPEKGVILLIVLWVLVALSVLAFGFASNVQMGARAVRNAKEGAVGYFLAKAAVNEAIYEAAKMAQPGTDAQAGISFKQQRVAHQPIALNLDTGLGQCWMENESGKFDLVVGSPLVFRNLLIRQFDAPEPVADVLLSGWNEWRKQFGGATGAIQGGTPTAVEDVLAIAGMKPEFVYGAWKRTTEGTVEFRRGLLELATVASNSARINLNYAPVEILRALPGVDARQADGIVNTRTQHFFQSVNDCQERVPIQFADETQNLVTTDESLAFTVVAKGRAHDAAYERTIRALVTFKTTDTMGYRILYWKDEEI